ncbi:MAG: CYTH domain-containing protein [Nanoarchaeota archaeon]|nr:CYTH domain-containing protein [Nanoarchaeota archaeon]
MEIEIRAFIKDFNKLKSKLDLLKAKKIDETDIEDIWFCKKEVTTYEETKMNKVGSYGLRIRLQDGRLPEITVKSIVSEGDHQIFDENETAFNDVEQMKKIFFVLGFKNFCTVKKNRKTYQYKDMKINLEDIEGFPPCVEIEILEDEMFEDHKEKIHSVLDMLEIDKDYRIDTSITSLFMEKFAFNQ